MKTATELKAALAGFEAFARRKGTEQRTDLPTDIPEATQQKLVGLYEAAGFDARIHSESLGYPSLYLRRRG